MISFNIDDGYLSAYRKAVPMFDAAGIKMTYYIPSDYLEYDGFVNVSQLRGIRDSGHEIGSHTKTHPYLTRLNPEQLKDQVAGSKAALQNYGFSISTFSYPYNDVNETVKKAVRDAGYVGAAGAGRGYNGPNTDPFYLYEWSLNSDLPLAEAKRVVDEAVANNKWAIFVLHKIDQTGTDDTNYRSEDLQALIDYVKAKGVKTTTNAEGLALMENMD